MDSMFSWEYIEVPEKRENERIFLITSSDNTEGFLYLVGNQGRIWKRFCTTSELILAMIMLVLLK